MKKLRVVFMGTPDFAVPTLEKLHSEFEIVGVFTQPDKPIGRGLETRPTPVKKRALEFGYEIFQPAKMTEAGAFEALASLKPDVIVVVAYGQILKTNVLQLPPLGCVNVHSSLLPRWRGAAPIQRALLEGDAETGVTIMKIVEKLDAGAILMQSKVSISASDTAGTIHDRLAQMGAELIAPTLRGLADKTLIPQEQDESLVTYAAKLTKEMEWLDPNESAFVLDRKIRALNPWPGTSLQIENLGRLKIKSAHVRREIKGSVGEIFERAGMVLLPCSLGALELEKMQWDGKKEVDASGFLNGLKGRGVSLPLKILKGK